MKDYIDKLREDYHRKKLQKLAFGDKFKDFGNNIRSKYYDIRYGTGNAPEQEVDENDNPIVKPTLPSLNNSKGNTSTILNNNVNQYGVQGKYNPQNIAISSVDFGLGPDISGSIGKNSAIDLKPQQKFQNTVAGISDITGDPTNNSMATQAVEKITKDAGIKTYKIADDQVVKDPTVKTDEKIDTKKDKGNAFEQAKGFFLPPQGDLTTNLYNLGRAIGAKPGTKGRGLSIAGNAGAAALEGARALFSGVGFSKAQGYTDQFNQQQMIDARKKYESNPQYKNTNYMGGPTQTRAGGTIRVYEDGGEQQMDPRMEQMMAQQQQADPRMQQEMDPRMAEQQQQMDPRMQQQEEAQMNQQEAQAYQQIAEKLVNSFETIEEIADYLNENGVDETAFNAIIKFAQDMIDDRDESADDNEEATEEPKEEEMRKGGKKFNKKVGEYIEFEYDGKVHKGVIKSIKNGQIFLK